MEKINGNYSSTHVEVEELKQHIGKTVQIHGIIYKIREMSGFVLVILKMKRPLLQCIYSVDFTKFPLSELKDNMSVIFTGEVINDERKPMRGVIYARYSSIGWREEYLSLSGSRKSS